MRLLTANSSRIQHCCFFFFFLSYKKYGLILHCVQKASGFLLKYPDRFNLPVLKVLCFLLKNSLGFNLDHFQSLKLLALKFGQIHHYCLHCFRLFTKRFCHNKHFFWKVLSFLVQNIIKFNKVVCKVLEFLLQNPIRFNTIVCKFL